VNNQAQLDRSFLAFSHPVRRQIVERLVRGPASVREATRGVSVSKPAVTKHVKVLEDAGLVRREIRGREHVLSLDGPRLAAATSWLELHRQIWESTFDAVERHLAAENERRAR
jgi:DNA-binding transcriptional ArsR family regulator